MPIPSLSEAGIRRQTIPQSFARGRNYYQQGAVVSVALRGQTLQAEVTGSRRKPYRVTVQFDANGVKSADCTCPYDYGGWCKHIVATLLTCVHEPERAEEHPPLSALLAAADRTQLLQLLLNLAEADPKLASRIETQLARLQTGPVRIRPPIAETRRATVAPNPFHQQAQAALYPVDGSESDGQAGSGVDAIRRLLNPVQDALAASDGRRALAILEAMTAEYVVGWTELEDADGATALFDDFGSAWTEALLTADLLSAERREWDAKLAEWQDSVSDYGVEAFTAARHAAQTGWDDPHLQRVLRGETARLEPVAEMPSALADELAAARLTVLDRQQRYDEFLRLAQADGRWGVYAMQLAYLGRTADAVAAGLKHLQNAGEALPLAAILREQGEPAAALQVAEHGLTLAGSKAELIAWLAEAGADSGNPVAERRE